VRISRQNRVTSDPKILNGKACIKGVRIPATLILGYLAEEKTNEDIIREFPVLTSKDIRACLNYVLSLADLGFKPAPKRSRGEKLHKHIVQTRGIAKHVAIVLVISSRE
jgi:uncharacterized protein (DUF433 family)